MDRLGTSEWVKLPATRPDDPSSIPGGLTLEGENELQKGVL